MDRSLLSLCLINTLWHKYKKTYVDNFVPLMATTFIKYKYNKIEDGNINELIERFNNDFGILLTKNPTLAILHKCKKNKIIKQYGKTYYVITENAIKFNLSREIDDNLEKQNKLLSNFKLFFQSMSDEIITDDIISNLILAFIKNNDVGLFLYPNRSDGDLLPDPKLPHNYKRYKYIFEKYISHIYNYNKDIFNILVEIALGSIATNALLFSFSDQTVQSIKNCEIYLDTSLILCLIGSDGKENSKSVSMLLESIRSNGAKLKIFEHTYEEAKEALDACLDWVDSINFNPLKANKTTLYFRQEGYKKSDIELLINSFDRLLRENDIKIVKTPEYTYENTLIDEKKFQKEFEEELCKRNKGFQKEEYKRRTQRDIASICAISRLRYGKKYIRSIKDAEYLFVTSNGALSITNYRYNKNNNRNTKHDIPECVTDVFLGTYLWINTPQIACSINNFKIIAVALSAIRPDPKMEDELRIEAEKLLDNNKITNDDFILLTSSHLVKDLLPDYLFSKAAIINESYLSSMLEEVKERLLNKKNKEINLLNEKLNIEKNEREKKETLINKLIIHLEAMAIKNAKKSSQKKLLIIILFFSILLLAPIIPAFTNSWYFLLISGIAGSTTILLSLKGLTFKNIKERLYQNDYLKERKILQIDTHYKENCHGSE